MATPPDDPAFQQLVLAYAASKANQTQQIEAAAAEAARSFSRWYDTVAIAEWAARLSLILNPRYRALARLTDAYLARSATMAAGKPLRAVGAVDVTALRSGVTQTGAYARSADQYRWQQSRIDAFTRQLASGVALLEPPDLQDPASAAVQRVLNVVDLDAQLVHRDQSRAFYEAHSGVITGWRRVIHPERSKGGTCGLCAVISDRLYGTTEPLEVHAHCECTTLAVVDSNDPGSTLNRADLRRLYKDAGSTGAAELKRTRYRIDEHGELGRVLTDAGDKVRTARQAKRDESKLRPARSPEEVRAGIERTRSSLAAALPKARELAATDRKKWGTYLTQLETRLDDLASQLAA